MAWTHKCLGCLIPNWNWVLSNFFSKVGNRIIRKRIHVRVEHVQPSRCRAEFEQRKIQNDKLKAEAKARGQTITTKRQPKGPKPGFMVEGATLETVTPIPYDVVNDLKGGYWLFIVFLHFVSLSFGLLFPISVFVFESKENTDVYFSFGDELSFMWWLLVLYLRFWTPIFIWLNDYYCNVRFNIA